MNFTFRVPNVDVPESQGFATVCVRKSQLTAEAIDVQISSQPGSATPNAGK